MTFQYRSLDEAGGDLRLLKLQPCSHGDNIKLHMQHVPLRESHRIIPSSSTIVDIQKNLHSDWTVFETLEGRYLFENGLEEYSSWTHPDPNIDKLIYNNTVTNVNESHSFEALSYTWGNELESTPIEIIDVQARKSGELLIRPNLATALRYLRLGDKERTLWIDAICINQNDLEERGKQVKRMDQIYRFAKQVNVWLGSESVDEHSDRAMELLGYIGAQVEYSKDQSYLEAPSCQEKGWFRPDVEIPLTDRDADAIRHLLERPWFSRLWIWQEVKLANASAQIYCGRSSISWYHFRRAILALDVKQQINPLISVPLLAHVSNLVLPAANTISLRLLWATRQAQCYDSRDRIYAVLGLLQPRFSSRVKPDYVAPSTTTYQRACKTWLKAYDKLTFLEFCDMREQKSELPTWVPDWSTKLPRDPMTFGRFASGQSGTGGAHVVDDKIIKVWGIVGGVVNWTEDLNTRADHEFWTYWRVMEKELGMRKKADATGETCTDALTSTLCGNRTREMYPAHIYWPTLADCWETLLDVRRQGYDEGDDEFNAYESSVREFTNGRRLFGTDEHMGMGPPSTNQGTESS